MKGWEEIYKKRFCEDVGNLNMRWYMLYLQCCICRHYDTTCLQIKWISNSICCVHARRIGLCDKITSSRLSHSSIGWRLLTLSSLSSDLIHNNFEVVLQLGFWSKETRHTRESPPWKEKATSEDSSPNFIWFISIEEERKNSR